MCNQYTTGFNFGQSRCGCNANVYNTCGNVEARQTTCRNHCGCCNCCCGNGGGGAGTQTGDGQTGRFVCVTVCGVGNTQTISEGELYYARQYGLYPFGYNRRCGCVLDAVSET